MINVIAWATNLTKASIVLGAAFLATAQITASCVPTGGATPSPTPTPGPTATPAPTVYYTPYANYVNANANATAIPITYTNYTTNTIFAMVKCNATSAGGTAVRISTIEALEVGKCDTSNTQGVSQDLHSYDQTNNVQAVPAVNLTAGTTYGLALTNDGTNLYLDVCSGGSSCSRTAVSDPNVLGVGSAGFIGATNGTNSRQCLCDIWNVQLGTTQTAAQILAVYEASSPDPYPTPTPAPTSSSGLSSYVFTQEYSSAQDGTAPLQTSVATLIALGKASVVSNSAAVMTNVFNQGIPSRSYMSTYGPVYIVTSSINSNAPQLTFTANLYGTNPYSGTTISLPTWAVNQCGGQSAKTSNPVPGSCLTGSTDQHLSIIDLKDNIIVDGWQCAVPPGTYNGTLYSGQLHCSWGRTYPVGSNGLSVTNAPTGYEAQHAGWSIAQIDLAPQEILNAEPPTNIPIAHALGLNMQCLNNPSIYPAQTSSSDNTCTSDTPGNYPQYGEMMHLKASYNIATSGYSAPCKAVLAAMQTYGVYFGDTGNGGLTLFSLSDYTYTSNPSNPTSAWQTVSQQLAAGGDGSGTYSSTNAGSTSWYNCLNRLSSSNFEAIQVTQ